MAVRLAADHFGVSGTAVPLPGEIDANFRITTPEGRSAVLKIMHPDRDPGVVDLQVTALARLAERVPEIQMPRVHRTGLGEGWVAAPLQDGSTRLAWMLSWVPGRPLADVRPRHGSVLKSLGGLLGRMDAALEGLSHPAAHRELKWDLTRAPWIGDHLGVIRDPHRRARLAAVLEEFHQVVTPVLPGLRRGIIHGDANDHNVLVLAERGCAPVATSVIDLGDMHHGPLVCELAVAAAYALLGTPDPLGAVARIVSGYHEALPLDPVEAAILVPLIRARLAVSVVNSALRTSEGHQDPYATISEAPAWEALERLDALPPRLGHYTVRAACGWPAVPHAPSVEAWLAAQSVRPARVLGVEPETPPLVFDLSFGSTLLGADPARLEAGVLDAILFGAMRDVGASLGIGRYDEPRPVYTAALFAAPEWPGAERRTVHMGLDLFAEAGTSVHAALDGTVHAVAYNPASQDYGGVIILRHLTDTGDPFHTLYGHLSADSVAGVVPGTVVRAGDRIAALGAIAENGGWPPHLHFQVITDLLELGTDFPGVVAPAGRAIWRSLSPDPAPLLGLPAGPDSRVDPEALRRQRGHVIGANVRLSYDAPLAIVRGWRQHLYDECGRAFLDVYNNVPLVGHSHPRVVAAVQRQLALLNTNSRYLHPNLVRYADALVARMPEPLRVCYVLNSASEANELALRLARARTGRRDLVVLEQAYHGHTTTLIDISPYKFNGPGGMGPPDWVHVAPLPDDYRGEFRRTVPDRGARYAEQVGAILAECAASGTPVGAFIAESLPSVGGQVELPAGYLAGVHARVRDAGGVCIADEVQVGFGRLGSRWWGFETQGVVPDIVVLGKPIGNGFPLAAVITTPEIAESFDTGMEFFSTFGGNPVACAAGLAVLEVLEAEGLMANADRVGRHLKRGLERLAAGHPIVGDVRGRGLFLGVELVRDRATLEPAGPEADYVVNRLRELGVLCGTDGPHHNVLKIRPPLCFSVGDADRFLALLDEVLAEDPVISGLSGYRT